MPKSAIKDWTLVLAGQVSGTAQVLDLSGYANAAMLEGSADERNLNTWDTTFQEVGIGREGSSFSLRAFIDDAAADPFENARGMKHVTDSALAAVSSNASMAEGDVAAFIPGGLIFRYSFPGDGIDALFTCDGMGEGVPQVLGYVLQQDAESLSATGNSVGIQITGGVPAGKRLYATEYIFSGTGTIDGKIESDTTSGFSAPTDRITFTQKAGEDYENASVAGAITDTWFRYNYTIVTGPFTALVVIGVG